MSNISLKILLLALSCTLFGVIKSHAVSDYNEQHILVSMRMIGHQVLLKSGDSTSRVLPIEKDSNRYKIRFESEFRFRPEELVSTVDSVAQATAFASLYFVEVETCNSGEIIYSYEIGDSDESIVIPCSNRIPPIACYVICITILDPLIEQSVVVEESNNSLIIIGILIVIILLGLLLFLRRKKSNMSIDSNLIPIGKYRFDNRNMALLFENEKIELTGKEGDLLYILHASANNTLKREIILNAVWGDEGDYVGRTLDVFVSKLRKKLEADSNVKIINIRGVGYKLVVNEVG